MIKLTLNKMSVPLPTDINFKFVVENPYFTDASEYTEEITLSNISPEVHKLFGAVHSHQCTKNKKNFDCELISDNHYIIRGKATTIEYSESAVKIQLLGGNSLVNFMCKWNNQYIDEIEEMGKFVDSWSQIFTTGVDPGGKNFAERIMAGPEEKEWVMLPSVCDDYDYPVNLFARYFPDTQKKQLDFGYPYGRLDNGLFAIQPRLTAIVRRLVNALGYEIGRFDAENTPFKYVYYVNVKNTFYLHEMLPHWTVNEFIDELQKFFNCVFVFDSVNMTCDIMSRSRFFSSEKTYIDIADDSFNVDLDNENDDIGAANIQYENDDIDISHMSNDYINEHCDVIPCNSHEELESIVLNGNPNVIGMFEGRQYVKHVEQKDDETIEKLEEINHLGCLFDKEAENVSVKIVAAALNTVAPRNYVLDDNNQPISYDSYPGIAPKGYSPNKSESFNVDKYIHTKTEQETNKLNVMAVAVFKSWNELPNTTIPVLAPDPDPLRPGEMYYIDLQTKLWCGWTYHVDDITGTSYSDNYQFNPTLALRFIDGYDTMYSMGPGSSIMIDKSRRHEFKIYDEIDLHNINKTYIIRGHKYLCEKIEVDIDAIGLKKIKKGTFYQID